VPYARTSATPCMTSDRIVARADNRIAAEFRSVLQHQIEGFCPRLFAELGEQSGVPARKLSEPPPG